MDTSEGREEPTWYTPDVVETWEDIEDRHKRYSCTAPESDCLWIFRGDRAAATLETKLERAFADYGVPEAKQAQYEMEMIREFQRKGGLYLEHEPDKDDVLEWLALMRHYSAPTRLTDWTYSFYVAVHFALADDLEGSVCAFDAAAVSKTDWIKSVISAGPSSRISGRASIGTPPPSVPVCTGSCCGPTGSSATASCASCGA